MKVNILLLFLAVALCSCKKENDGIIGTEQERLSNLSYGTDARQKMDVYLPAYRTESTPLVVLLHGGSWISGNKEDVQFIQAALQQQGIASVNMNYRYASATNHYEGMMADVAAALAFVRNHADEWRVRDKGVVLLGVSAGAHMGLLYAYGYKKPGEINAVISLAGPGSFSSEFLGLAALSSLKQAIEYMAGAAITALPLNSRFTEASPAAKISNVPTLMVHGTADLTVPYQQSVILQAMLTGKGVTNKLVTIEGAGHDLGLAVESNRVRILGEVISWINNYSNAD
ncbi:alpha/beta hydrolase [Arcticibacter tournemirensis]|uniref:Alpha/beta hydrolase n=1 Tax=Arcticibacter tournemirensis TaxID=699437 RepID=A0A4Q0MCN4_9SPHI|nr:alpha/beta hydrolase [Arcticibacter tournemirensis]RXF71111.1 alpha/beta hydrolase [Arcticibacter tournemirensis]